MTEPTDAELLAEWDRVSHIADAGQRRLACLRAVLAKWGTPTPVGVEPVAYRHMHDDGWEYYDAPTGDDCPGCQALYTDQVLAMGRVPLTDEQLYLERRFAVSSLFHLIEQWTDKKIQSHQLADEAGKIVDHVIRRTEAAHGIKGGQHGAE